MDLYRPVNSNDILVDIAYCGLCAADIDWTQGCLNYPTIPGHKIVGMVEEVRSGVTRLGILLVSLHICIVVITVTGARKVFQCSAKMVHSTGNMMLETPHTPK